MIFVGDIAIPYAGAINFVGFPASLKEKIWIGNLEGAIVKKSQPRIHAVFNQDAAISDLLMNYNFKALLLANNHILDTGNREDTITFLAESKVKFAGLGADIDDANKFFILKEGDVEVVIVNFGWEVIQCKIASDSKEGVNPLRKQHVLDTVRDLIGRFPDKKVLPVFHWSYELEAEPQPFERELAKKLIDLRVVGVIGAHPHRIGGIEFYNGKSIIYSLGNWAFRQGYYHTGKLNFPDFCNEQLAFEWDFYSNEMTFHFFKYDKKEHVVSYVESSHDLNKISNKYTKFGGLSDEEYCNWYRKNHYHKNKGLPIYYWNDSYWKVAMKNQTNKIRDFLLSVYLKFR